MSTTTSNPPGRRKEADYSLFRLLRPGAIADPYPLYKKIRDEEPVHWDPYLNSWVITGYAECLTALQKFKASRTPSAERLDAMGLSVLKTYAQLMLKQLLFMDPPSHTRIRGMCSSAFTPRRMETMRGRLTEGAHALIDMVCANGRMDLVADFARPFSALVLATLIGLPGEDVDQLLHWVGDVSELLGNFEHDPDRVEGLVQSVLELKAYLTDVLAEQRKNPGEGVMPAMMASEVDGEPRLTDEEIVASDPAAHPDIMTSGIEELLRFNSPTQHTSRVAPEDLVLGSKEIRQGQAVTIVVAAANRDPLRFPEPDKLDLLREDNRHLAFGWAAHYCLGAPLARLAGQIAFTALTGRLTNFALGEGKPRWRDMAAMRGLTSLPITFDARQKGTADAIDGANHHGDV